MFRLFLFVMLLALPVFADETSDDDHRQRQDEILKALIEKMRDRRAPPRVTPRGILKALPEGAALVDFMEYESFSRKEGRLLRASVYHGKKIRHVDLGFIAPMQEALRRYVAPLESSPPGKMDLAAGKTLRKLLWQPLTEHLQGAERVLVAPDGFVYGVPFAALPGEKAGTYMIEDYSVEVVRSASHVMEKFRKVKTGPALFVGGLDHGKGTRASALPGSGRELDAIAALYRKLQPDKKATVAKSISRKALAEKLTGVGRPAMVHLAVPAFFGTPPPPVKGAVGRARMALAIGLCLTNANTDANKGMITAAEIAGLDMAGCELVVLTGSGTGRAVYARGEGGLGLSLAFGVAGARSVVGAAWQPGEAATSALMREFYSRVWGKEPMQPWEALREAQLAVLRNPKLVSKDAKDKRSHPALWACWVLAHQGR
jgi:CHAT domain-containing protein